MKNIRENNSEKRAVRRDIQLHNMMYLKYRIERGLVVNKVLFVLTLIMEAFVVGFSLMSYTSETNDSANKFFMLIAYAVFAIPYLIAFFSSLLDRYDMTNMFNSAYESLEEEEAGEITSLIADAKDSSLSQLAIILLVFAVFVMILS